MNEQKANRRKFLKNSSLGLIGSGFIGKKGISIPNQAQEDEPPKIKEYRTLGRTGFKVSNIGMGTPKNPAIIKAALNAGVNYLDTSPNYGPSERDIGKVINEFDRKSIFITTKITSQHSLSKADLGSKDVVLNHARKSLEKLNVDYIDCYILAEFGSRETVNHKGFHQAIDQLKAEGRVRYCGIACHNVHSFSFQKQTMHDILLHAIEDGRFDLLLLVYNYLYSEEGAIIMKAAKKRNIATTIMKSNPVTTYPQFKAWAEWGAANNREVPKELEEWLPLLDKNVTDAESYISDQDLVSTDEQLRDIATKFVLDNPNADCLLVQMKTFSDIDFYLKCSGEKLTRADQRKLEVNKLALNNLYCRHSCGICEVSCPHGVPVNTIMHYNYYFQVKGEEKYAMNLYREMEGSRPDVCINCEGFCEKACPYGVLTRPLLMMAQQNLSFDNRTNA